MTQKQWNVMMAVNADLCEHYGIKIAPKTLCGHGAIYGHYGEANRTGKWDPLRLPWKPQVDKRTADEIIRHETQLLITGDRSSDALKPDERPVLISLNGIAISDDAFTEDGLTWVPLRLLSEPLGFMILDTDRKAVLVSKNDGPVRIPFQIRGNTGYVPIKELRLQIGGFTTGWDPATRTVKVSLV
jgi:hypothetical protein